MSRIKAAIVHRGNGGFSSRGRPWICATSQCSWSTVSSASFREQGYDRETTAAIADLGRLNAAYEQRFGFRFCIFVNGRSRPELVPELEAALVADRDAEIRRALHDVIAIARDRFDRSGSLVEVAS